MQINVLLSITVWRVKNSEQLKNICFIQIQLVSVSFDFRLAVIELCVTKYCTIWRIQITCIANPTNFWNSCNQSSLIMAYVQTGPNQHSFQANALDLLAANADVANDLHQVIHRQINQNYITSHCIISCEFLNHSFAWLRCKLLDFV